MPSFNSLARYLAPGLITLPLIVGPSGPACVDDLASTESLSVTDASTGCNSTSGSTPYAVGSRVDLNVDGPDGRVQAPEVTLNAQGVWSSLDRRSEDVSLTLEALQAGTTTLTVRDALGRDGQMDLEAAPIASGEITPWRDMQPFNLDVGLNPGNVAPETVAPNGYSLLPDTELVLHVTLKDADGRVLGGYGAADWGFNPTTDGTALTTVEAGNDDVRLRHDGSALGPVTITGAGGASFTLERAGQGAAASLEVIHVETGQRGTSITLKEGEVGTVVALVYDAEGRLLIGDDGDRLTVELTNDGVTTVVPPPWSEGEDGIDLTPALEEQLLDVRAFYVQGTSAGTTALTLGVAGLSLNLPVTVEAP